MQAHLAPELLLQRGRVTAFLVGVSCDAAITSTSTAFSTSAFICSNSAAISGRNPSGGSARATR
jgi:hypothetical protein